MAITPDKHLFSSDDVHCAEAAQSVCDGHDELATAFAAQHRNWTGGVGTHISQQQIGALLIIDTPDGIATKHRPIDKVATVNVREVNFEGQAFSIKLASPVDPQGAKAWVLSTFTGGPLTSLEMDYLTPKVSRSPTLLDWWLIDFQTTNTYVTPDGIRRLTVVWWGRGGI